MENKEIEESTVSKKNEDMNTSVANAKEWMVQKLARGGLYVIKHGRSGKPKKRRLQCDYLVEKLFCRTDSVYKEVLISDILYVRRGTDVDPASQVSDGFASGANPNSESFYNVTDNSGIFGQRAKKTILDQGTILFGSANLRRTCKQEDMAQSVSLVTPERTFDIQFLGIEDFENFFRHISVLVAMNASTRPTSTDTSKGSSNRGINLRTKQNKNNEALSLDDIMSSALDVEFLVQQGFNEKAILTMCESVREEALLRSKQTEKVRLKLNLNVPKDQLEELAINDNDSVMTDDNLAPEDQDAINLLMNKGYSEEEALQIHLQSLYLDESDKPDTVKINVH